MNEFLKMSPTQIVISSVFLVLIVVGMGVLAFGQFGSSSQSVDLVMWGTLPRPYVLSLIENSGVNNLDAVNKIEYVEKDPISYDREIVDALAEGTGPDIFMIAQDDVLEHKKKITPIPFDSYPLRTFNDTFIRGAELFVFDDGIYALPLTVDPLIMYWNTALFSNAGVARPPQYWDELFDYVPRLTVKDQDLDISQSAFAMGEFDNITNAKYLVSTLLMQNDIPIVAKVSGRYQSSFSPRNSNVENMLTSVGVFNYFTQFSNSASEFYTWNRSLPDSQDYFVQTDLAIYFGFASELSTIREKNPNLSFDVASLPQSRGNKQRVTFGKMMGLAIARTSKYKSTSVQAIKVLTSKEGALSISDSVDLPPVRVDAFQAAPDSSYMPVFQEMALIAQAWLEPTSEDGDNAFRGIINSITSGRRSISGALSNGKGILNEAYDRVD